MKKIPTLFKRNYDGNHLVYDEITEGCEWVESTEAIATRKHDGTCCMIMDDNYYKRYDVKKGRSVPEIGIPCQDKPDEITGHWPWWVPVGNGPEDKYHNEAFEGTEENGTYELIGPKINGNKEMATKHHLIKHGSTWLIHVPTDFIGLEKWFRLMDIEGIVWHHPDGRMVKIKRKDFGYEW